MGLFSKTNLLMMKYEFEKETRGFIFEILKIIEMENESIRTDSEKLKDVFSEAKIKLKRFVRQYKNADDLLTKYQGDDSVTYLTILEDGTEEILNYKRKINEFLKERGYNDRTDLKMLIRKLTSQKIDSFLLYCIQKDYTELVKEVSVENDGLVKLVTKDNEEFNFYLADKYLSVDSEFGKYIKSKKVGQNLCHEYTQDLQKIFPDAYSVIAKLPRVFDENYYMHSYVELDDDFVLDLTLNILMRKTDYERFVRPEIIFRCKNKKIEEFKQECFELIEADSDYEEFKDCGIFEMLVLAAYEELKRNKPKVIEKFRNQSQPS